MATRTQGSPNHAERTCPRSGNPTRTQANEISSQRDLRLTRVLAGRDSRGCRGSTWAAVALPQFPRLLERIATNQGLKTTSLSSPALQAEVRDGGAAPGPHSLQRLRGRSLLASCSFWWPLESLGLWLHRCISASVVTRLLFCLKSPPAFLSQGRLSLEFRPT